MRNNKKLTRNIIIGISAFCVLTMGIGYHFYDQNKNMEEEIAGLREEMGSNQQEVYVAIRDIEKGERLYSWENVDGNITEADVNVELQMIYSGLEPTFYMTEEDLGKQTVIDLKETTPVYKEAVTDVATAADTREFEMSVVNVMTDQRENDYVDIRITYPNGEDYIVLPKKQVKNLNLENCVFYSYLNEEEILRMQSATIDAYLNSGTRIYTTRYVESNLQEEAVPTYLVRTETIDLINSDPNVLTLATETLNIYARMDLEARLSALTEDQLKAVVDGNGVYDAAKTSIITSKYADTVSNNEDEYGEDIYEDTTEEDMNKEDAE